MPPAPITRNPSPPSRNAICHGVGSGQLLASAAPQCEGCSLEIAAVSVSSSIPTKDAIEANAKVL
uniref:Proton-dependent oligopeptide transport family protein n=1 Tax=Rhizophora mucronata TaxID=61149 RepID=A0A2P2IZ49_RHIMU